MKLDRLLVMLLALCLVLIIIPFESNAIIYGEGQSWSLDEGTLSVSADAMADYDSVEDYPWYQYRDQITGVVFLGSCEYVGSYAFAGYPNLETVTLGNVKTISKYAFYQCTKLKKISVSYQTVTMAQDCFSECTSLVETVIPRSVTTLDRAFRNCTGLKVLTFYGGNPMSANEDHFENVTAAMQYPNGDETWTQDAKQQYGGNLTWGAYDDFGCFGDSLQWHLKGDTLVIRGVGKTGDYAYSGDITYPWHNHFETIQSVVVEDGVTYIGNLAFGDMTALKNVTISSSVTGMGKSVFYRCSSLTEVKLPSSITDMGDGVFKECTGLRKVELPKNITELPSELFYGCVSLESVDIPDSVTEICSEAFYCCKALTKIQIPDNVTKIGAEAFYYCNGLTELQIPDDVTHISNRAFALCEGLTELILPENLEYLGKAVFKGCDGIKSLVIPAAVKDVYQAFQEGSLEYVKFLGDMPLWDNAMFEYAEPITVYYPSNNRSWNRVFMDQVEGEVTWTPYESDILPDGIVAEGAAGNMTWSLSDEYVLTISGQGPMNENPWRDYRGRIMRVVIEDGITSICRQAFYECKMLAEITVGKNVETVDSAFGNTPNLQKIKFTGDAPEFARVAFNNVSTTIYYPANNETWTEEVMQQYGGTLTWESYWPNPFTDVSENKYYYEPVLWAYYNGITSGKTATTFEPNTTCTRAQVMTFLWAAAGRPEPTSLDNPFTDVSESAYYYKAVLWAVEKGITSGTTATTFSPNASCTRNQVVTFLWVNAGRPEPTIENPFTDVEEGKYYYKAILWAYENGITSGKSATTFEPHSPCTRGQIVTFLYQALAEK